jgi:prepilin-type N-terminal cleavage/methylation domain-containing protein
MSIKNMSKERGFTIVELLIVIVVIGILAAITIVAYNGVQNRARTTTNQANAQEVQNKAEVYAADTGNGVFPANGTAFEAIVATDTAALSPKVKLLLGTVLPASGTPTVLIYQQCGTDGAKVGYYDHVTPGVVYLYAGNATSATTCAAAA